jgi:hypothetical protein
MLIGVPGDEAAIIEGELACSSAATGFGVAGVD